MGGSLSDLVLKPVEEIAKLIGFNTELTIVDIVANLISVFLSLLGIIFLILILYGGYTYMMSRGNESEAKKALMIIRNAVIGLLITLSAYSISYLVTNAAMNAVLK